MRVASHQRRCVMDAQAWITILAVFFVGSMGLIIVTGAIVLSWYDRPKLALELLSVPGIIAAGFLGWLGNTMRQQQQQPPQTINTGPVDTLQAAAPGPIAEPERESNGSAKSEKAG